MPSLRPPNRKNKKRLQSRAVERFKGEVYSVVDEVLQRKFNKIFKNANRRQNSAEHLVKNKILAKEVESFQKHNENLSWNNFKVGNRQKTDIKTFLKKRITMPINSLRSWFPDSVSSAKRPVSLCSVSEASSR